MSIHIVNEPVANNIVRIIRENGIKQSFVAMRIGCSKQELNDMLNGRRIIKVNDVPKICSALGVGIDELFRENEAV